MVSEVDLLKHMLDAGHTHTPEETIAGIIRQTGDIYPADTPLEAALPAIVSGSVVLVTENEKLTGIVTKIDVLDFMAQDL